MDSLIISKTPCGSGMHTAKITGFTDAELSDLKRIPNADAKVVLLAMLDNRNNGIGTTWQCGYGVYGLWFDNEAAYVNIGSSCD